MVTNLHAFIETKQNEILTVADPVGEHCDDTILVCLAMCDMTICDWGANEWSITRADAVKK